MKKSPVVIVAVFILMLCACTGSEHTALTGAYGSGVITGQVFMTAGGSPAGVEVSVRNTGMSVILGADGKFSFAGVPEELELVFQRPADGIAASLRLDGASGHVVVDLAQTTAQKSGRRRAAGRSGGTVVHQIEGILQSASATSIVVDTQRQAGINVALTATTTIRHGQTVMTPEELEPGMRVHVVATSAGGGPFTALSVVVQNDGTDDGDDGDDGGVRPSVREYEGTVVRASATELVIFDSKKHEVTFVIDAETVIRKGSTPVLATDLLAGWRVHVKATTATDGTKTATLVIVQRTSR